MKRLAFLYLILVAGLGSADPTFDTQYKVKFDSRLGMHLRDRVDLSTHRHSLEFEQKAVFKPHWTFVGSMRAFAEAAFATNEDRYAGSAVVARESSEVWLRDLYLQYKGDNFSLRLGNQQVIWGETFGFYYADIVNPKDMREFGLWDLNIQRLPVPMANAKLLFDKASIEALYIPKPFFNKMPSVGNDFAWPVQKFVPGGNASIVDDRTLPLAFENGEAGLRLSAQIASLDLSIFYFYYFDRTPHYVVRPTSFAPPAFEFDATHPRIFSAGTTGSFELSPFVFRWEALLNAQRPFDGIYDGNYGIAASNEWVAVLGTEYTGMRNTRLGMQISETLRSDELPGAFYARSRPLLSLHGNIGLWADHSIDLITSYMVNDSGTLTQVRYLWPISHQFECVLGADMLTGADDSMFGRFKAGSRAFVLLRGYFSG